MGDLYLPRERPRPRSLSRLSRELHLPIVPLDRAPAGPAFRVKPVRVGLYKPWVANLDEGWTRFLLERYGFNFQNLDNAQMKAGSYAGKVDVILLPSVSATVIEKGANASTLPPPYAGGLDKEGGEKLKKWVEDGGTLVALDDSSGYAIKLLELPVTNVLEKVSEEQFHVPGSMLRIRMDTTHPLSWGMSAEEVVFFADSPAFETRLPDARFERRVVATYPDQGEDILVSGYLKGADKLERKAAAVELKAGKGRVVLIGFHPQHRAQPHRTFKLLWNALYWGGLEEAEIKP